MCVREREREREYVYAYMYVRIPINSNTRASVSGYEAFSYLLASLAAVYAALSY